MSRADEPRRLEPSFERPFRRTSTEILGRSGRFALRRDLVVWPDGTTGEYTVVEGPRAAVVVPVGEKGETVLVRQWRHPWDSTSWELPAGTLGSDEDPLMGARRELAEEAGLEAAKWTPLGTGRATASATILFHFFLAQELTGVDRSPEVYEQDMILKELPLPEAIDSALDGGILHTASIAALCRAARHLGLI